MKYTLLLLSLTLVAVAYGKPCTDVVNCFVDPCMVATCPELPEAECRSNYCGGCNANFVLDGEDVSSQCSSGGALS